MRVIICGVRDIGPAQFTDYELVCQAVQESGFAITEVVSGGARGVDLLGERWAAERDVPVHRIEADWQAFGKSAGVIRNGLLCAYAEAVVAIWDEKSRGTKDCLERALRKGLPIHLQLVNS